MIEINLEKKIRTYEGIVTLKVQTIIKPGSVVVIYGPSGSGKTTFLKILAGLTVPENGLIDFDGQLWLNTSTKFSLPVQKRRVGFVFQNYALFPNMTVLEHLKYATKDTAWIARLLKLGRLDTLQAHKPEFMSGGQQQRLAILRALAIKPSLLLMDEPFSALDKAMRTELTAELKELITEWPCTCLIVSHDPDIDFGQQKLQLG